MRSEAAEAGFYESTAWGQTYPRLQLRTVQELLAGKAVERPPGIVQDEALKRAPKAKPAASEAHPELGI